MDDALELIPRHVRDKLDRVGIKLHLKEWQALPYAEREQLCAAACDTRDEQAAFAAAIDRAVERATGRTPDRLASTVTL